MLTLDKPSMPDTIYVAGIVPHVTLAQVFSSLKDMRRYTLGASFKGKKQVFNLEPMTYKQAMIMRSKYTYYPHLSIEIIRLGV